MRRIVDETFDRAVAILTERRSALEKSARLLLDRETLDLIVALGGTLPITGMLEEEESVALYFDEAVRELEASGMSAADARQEAARAVVTEPVESGVSLEDYQPDGGYGAQLREALEEESRSGEEQQDEREEEPGDSLEEDESSNTKN